jgi:hypothetical protein
MVLVVWPEEYHKAVNFSNLKEHSEMGALFYIDFWFGMWYYVSTSNEKDLYEIAKKFK